MHISRINRRSHRVGTIAATCALILGSSLSSLLVLDSSAGAATIASNAASTISVTTPVLTSGVTTAMVKVVVDTPSGAPVSGGEVTLVSSSLAVDVVGSVSGTATEVTNGSGVVSFGVNAGSVIDGVTFTATDTADGLNISSLPVNFALNALNVSSSITATNTLYADGVSASIVTVTAVDGFGVPVPNDVVTLTDYASSESTGDGQPSSAIVSGSAHGVPTATTNSLGVATFDVTDTVVEELIFFATDTSSLALYSAPVDVQPVTVDSTTSNIYAASDNVTANGVDATTIFVTVNDSAGNPVSGDVVTLTGTDSNQPTNAVIAGSNAGTATSTTDSSGNALFSVTDPDPDSEIFHATDTSGDLNIQSNIVTFLGGDDSTSTIRATNVVGDSSTVTVTERDQNGSLVANDSILLKTNVGLGTESTTTTINGTAAGQLSLVTNSMGVATFEVSDSAPENVEFDAWGSDGTFLATSVDYSGGTPVATGTISATDNILANGQATSLVTVNVQDGDGVPFVDVTVSLSAYVSSAPDTTAIVTPMSTTTDVQGDATFTVSDSVIEQVELIATYTQNATLVTVTDPLAFVEDVPDPATSHISTTDGADADGHTVATVSVWLRDAAGNPFVDTVTLTPTGTDPDSDIAFVGNNTATTNAGGEATFTVTDNDVDGDSVSFVAQDPSGLDDTNFSLYSSYLQDVQFEPPTFSSDSTLVSTTPVLIGGLWTSTVTVTANDADGHALSLPLQLTLVPESGSGVITVSAPATTNASGQATFTVTDTLPESIYFLAYDPHLYAVYGNAATPSSPTSTIAVTTPVATVGSSTGTVTVTALDDNGQPIAFDDLNLTSSNNNVTVTPESSGETDTDGVETFTVSALIALSGVTFEATDSPSGYQTLDITSNPVSFPAPEVPSAPGTPTGPTNAPPPTVGGLTAADFGTPVSGSVAATTGASLTATSGAATADLTVPAGALPTGTTVSLYPVIVSTSIATQLASLSAAPSYMVSFAVSWQAPDGTSPTATLPLTLTITDPAIKVGDVLYAETATGLTQVGVATTAGTASVTFTNDPVFVLAHPQLVAQAPLTVTSTTGHAGRILTLRTSGGTGTGAVSYTFAGGGTAAGCKLSGSTLTSTGAGTCVVTATKAADATDLVGLSSATTITLTLPAKPGALTVRFSARAHALTTATKTSIARLAKSLLKGASVTITGDGLHNAALAKSRATAAEKFLLTKVKVHVKIVVSTGSSLNAAKITTTKQ